MIGIKERNPLPNNKAIRIKMAESLPTSSTWLQLCEKLEQSNITEETHLDCEDEQIITREDNQAYRENYRPNNGCVLNANHPMIAQERNETEEAIKNKRISPGRARLQLWLYRSMRIVMTDGRILIGIFLCTDAAANVILGVCSEFTKNGTDERMLGLVMVPGKIQFNF